MEGGRNEGYFSRWERDRRRVLSRSYVAWMERRFDPLVRTWGYRMDRLEVLEDLEAGAPWSAEATG